MIIHSDPTVPTCLADSCLLACWFFLTAGLFLFEVIFVHNSVGPQNIFRDFVCDVGACAAIAERYRTYLENGLFVVWKLVSRMYKFHSAFVCAILPSMDFPSADWMLQESIVVYRQGDFTHTCEDCNAYYARHDMEGIQGCGKLAKLYSGNILLHVQGRQHKRIRSLWKRQAHAGDGETFPGTVLGVFRGAVAATSSSTDLQRRTVTEPGTPPEGDPGPPPGPAPDREPSPDPPPEPETRTREVVCSDELRGHLSELTQEVRYARREIAQLREAVTGLQGQVLRLDHRLDRFVGSGLD